MSKRCLPVMFHIIGKPGIFSMEEVIRIEPHLKVKPVMVEPYLIQGHKTDRMNKMELSAAIKKFE